MVLRLLAVRLVTAFSLAPFEFSMQPYRFSRGVPRMPFRLLLLICFLLLASPCFGDEAGPPPLSIGASAPAFCLPGIDGQTHCLKGQSGRRVLVIVYACSHCEAARQYEARIKRSGADYRDR